MKTPEILELMAENRELFNLGDWDVIEGNCKPSLSRDDLDPVILTLLGILAGKRGQNRIGCMYLDEAFKRLKPRDQVRDRLTDFVLDLCDPDLAHFLIKSLVDRYGNRPDLRPEPTSMQTPAAEFPPLSRYWPCMTEFEVRAMLAALDQLSDLGRSIKVLEWGSGHSTFYFSGHLTPGSAWTSVEHDHSWFKSVEAEERPSSGAAVSALFIPANAPLTQESDDGDMRSFRDYVKVPVEGGKEFDLILVDGRARVDCMRNSWPSLSRDGVMVLHDAWREEYLPGYPDTPWRISVDNPRSAVPSRLVFFLKSESRYRSLAASLAIRLPDFVELTFAGPLDLGEPGPDETPTPDERLEQVRPLLAQGRWDDVEARFFPDLESGTVHPSVLTLLAVLSAKRGLTGLAYKMLEVAYRRLEGQGAVKAQLVDVLFRFAGRDMACHLLHLLAVGHGDQPAFRVPSFAASDLTARPMDRYWPNMGEIEIQSLLAALDSLGFAGRPNHALEWGSGHSTLHFSGRMTAGSTWDALEHNLEFFGAVNREPRDPGGAEVRIHHVPASASINEGVDDGDFDSFRDYVLFPRGLGLAFDLILVDGRARIDCMREGWKLLSDDGIMVLHDAERPEYQPGYPDAPYRLRLLNPNVAVKPAIAFFLKSEQAFRRFSKALEARLPAYAESARL